MKTQPYSINNNSQKNIALLIVIYKINKYINTFTKPIFEVQTITNLTSFKKLLLCNKVNCNK